MKPLHYVIIGALGLLTLAACSTVCGVLPSGFPGCSASPTASPAPTEIPTVTPTPLSTPEPTTAAQSTPEPTTAAEATPTPHHHHYRRHYAKIDCDKAITEINNGETTHQVALDMKVSTGSVQACVRNSRNVKAAAPSPSPEPTSVPTPEPTPAP
jgi:hypothetical protein